MSKPSKTNRQCSKILLTMSNLVVLLLAVIFTVKDADAQSYFLNDAVYT